MSEDPTNEVDLATAAAGPRRAQDDTGSMEQHSLPDLIAADKHLAARKASRNPLNALRNGLIGVNAPGAF